ncbi:MAG: hypothetical protein Q8L47_00960 [bacterium]|nr:hypothetical protein [bacterium]
MRNSKGFASIAVIGIIVLVVGLISFAVLRSMEAPEITVFKPPTVIMPSTSSASSSKIGRANQLDGIPSTFKLVSTAVEYNSKCKELYDSTKQIGYITTPQNGMGGYVTKKFNGIGEFAVLEDHAKSINVNMIKTKKSLTMDHFAAWFGDLESAIVNDEVIQLQSDTPVDELIVVKLLLPWEFIAKISREANFEIGNFVTWPMSEGILAYGNNTGVSEGDEIECLYAIVSLSSANWFTESDILATGNPSKHYSEIITVAY